MSYAISADEPSGLTPAALSAAVHLALLGVLVFGLHWQSKHPDAVEVELWSQLPEVESPPRVETPPKVEPRPEAKPPPKVEQKAAIKPDIAIEREKKASKKKEEPLKFDVTSRMQQQLAQEQKALQDSSSKDAAKQPAQPAPPPSPDAGYVDKIRSKIKSNVVVPSGISGNPEAIFDVVQLPTGEVLPEKLRLVKSSGNKLYDEAVERAILKSSPLPKPDRPEQFLREFTLRFKPYE
jgi:colicin import membrane protein